MKTASDIMVREVKTIPVEATLREAAEMLSLWQVSGAPVTGADGKLAGILSESDLLSEARKRAGMPRIAAFGIFLPVEESLQRIYHDGATLQVGDVMTTKVLTVRGDTPLDEVGETMVRRRINRIPVVDADGAVVGIVTREDLLKALFGIAEG